MAFGLPKIDVPAITKDLNEKFQAILSRLDAILAELKKQSPADPPPPPPNTGA